MLRNCLVLMAGVCLLVGCTNSDLPHTAPVTGKVTYQGKAVDGATVSFIGETAELRTATAISGADGTYQLMTLDAKGAMPGNYVAVVTKTELPPEMTQEVSMEDAAKMANRPPPQPKRLLPAKYGDPEKTPLRFEVKNGQTNKIDLPLAD